MSLSNLRRWLILCRVPHEEKEKLREVLQALLEDGSVELTSRGKYIKAAQEHLTGVFTAHSARFWFCERGREKTRISLSPLLMSMAPSTRTSSG